MEGSTRTAIVVGPRHDSGGAGVCGCANHLTSPRSDVSIGLPLATTMRVSHFLSFVLSLNFSASRVYSSQSTLSTNSMSANLSAWAETRLTALYSAHDDAVFTSAYEEAFAPDVTMRLAQAPTEADGTPKSNIKISVGEGVNEKTVQAGEAREELQKRAMAAAQTTSSVEFGDLDVDDQVCIQVVMYGGHQQPLTVLLRTGKSAVNLPLPETSSSASAPRLRRCGILYTLMPRTHALTWGVAYS
jgi:hypothetical protein